MSKVKNKKKAKGEGSSPYKSHTDTLSRFVIEHNEGSFYVLDNTTNYAIAMFWDAKRAVEYLLHLDKEDIAA